MTVFRYNNSFDPPAPLVYVTLRHPQQDLEVADVPGQIDTACDRTSVPRAFIERLGLIPLREIQVAGFENRIYSLSTYYVQVAIKGHSFLPLEVAAGESEAIVLVGRDVLNHFKLTLDGPQLKMEISDP